MFEFLREKKVLFITTKNLDYIRNSQEISLLDKAGAECTVIGYMDRKYSKRLIKIFFKLLTTSMKEYDAVFCGFAPQLIIPFWSWKFRGKFLYIDFFISVYDTFVNDRKKIKEGTIGSKIAHGIDSYTLQKADHVIVDTKEHGKYFSDEFECSSEKMEVLYLVADKSIYYLRSIDRLDKFKGKFLVLYFGSILPLQGVEVIMDAVKILQNESSIHFLMIGPIQNHGIKKNFENVTYIDWLSQTELADYIAQADLCLAGHFNSDVEKARRTIPGKAYIYEAMGKRMILGENNANHELFIEDKMHYFVPMGDAKELANKILEIKQDQMADLGGNK